MNGDERSSEVLPRVLIFAPSFAPASRVSGPTITLINLVREVSSWATVDVVTRDRDVGGDTPFPRLSGKRVTQGHATVYYLNERSRVQWLTLLRELSAHRYEMILVNSVWDLAYSFIPVMAASGTLLHGPVVLMPHGELEPGALALKAAKKRLAAPLLKAAYGGGVRLFGATSREEFSNTKSWWPRKAVLISTNNMPDTLAMGFPQGSSETLRVTFLGRIHPTKGLRQLIGGLAQAQTGVCLTVHGPEDDSDYWRSCQAAAERLPSNVEFQYRGQARRREIAPIFWNSDCMVLLTAGENYGHVIAEALQAGCPVITTPTTPWTDVIRTGGGSIVTNRDDPQEVAQILDSWGKMTDDELLATRWAARDAYERFAATTAPNIVELALAEFGHPKRGPDQSCESDSSPIGGDLV